MIPSVDFIGMSDAALVDEAAKLHALAEAIDKKLKEAKEILRSRGQKEIFGHTFKATVGDTIVSWSLDKEKVNEAMGKAWVLKHSKQNISAGRVTFKPHVTLGDIKVA